MRDRRPRVESLPKFDPRSPIVREVRSFSTPVLVSIPVLVCAI